VVVRTLTIEDLHWAGSSTLDLLAHLCAADQDGVTPVVLTCREEETGRPGRPVDQRPRPPAWLPADGLSSAEIGARLFTSGRAASVHVTTVLRGLGVENRTEAANLAQRAGLLRKRA
jgi:ATP/maltotriose-dependent transcriptional regulator MalT